MADSICVSLGKLKAEALIARASIRAILKCATDLNAQWVRDDLAKIADLLEKAAAEEVDYGEVV